jgi:hypothetical protein
MRYRVLFIRDFENITRGQIAMLPENEAISVVNSGYAVYYII